MPTYWTEECPIECKGKPWKAQGWTATVDGLTTATAVVELLFSCPSVFPSAFRSFLWMTLYKLTRLSYRGLSLKKKLGEKRIVVSTRTQYAIPPTIPAAITLTIPSTIPPTIPAAIPPTIPSTIPSTCYETHSVVVQLICASTVTAETVGRV